jgi:hypothetical protein
MVRKLAMDQLALREGLESLHVSLENRHLQMQERMLQSSCATSTGLLEIRTEQQQKYAAIRSDALQLQESVPEIEASRSRKATCSSGQPADQCESANDHGNITRSLVTSARERSAICLTATVDTHQCPSGCRCQCHSLMSARTPRWLKGAVGQLSWDYNSSVSVRPCDYVACRKSRAKHQVTYYFPAWLLSRAVVASADLSDPLGMGARVSINVPLIIPENDHIVWSLVMAGNIKQLQILISHEKNLMYVRNQWGQTLMHVSCHPWRSYWYIKLLTHSYRSLQRYINPPYSTSSWLQVQMSMLRMRTIDRLLPLS